MKCYVIIFILLLSCSTQPELINNIDSSSLGLIKINDYYSAIDSESRTMYFPLDSTNLSEFIGVVETDKARRKSVHGVKFISEEELLNTKGLQVVAMLKLYLWNI